MLKSMLSNLKQMHKHFIVNCSFGAVDMQPQSLINSPSSAETVHTVHQFTYNLQCFDELVLNSFSLVDR